MVRFIAAIVAAVAAILLFVTINQYSGQAPLVTPTGGVVNGGTQDAVPTNAAAQQALLKRADLQRWRDVGSPGPAANPQGTPLKGTPGAPGGKKQVQSWLSRYGQDRNILRNEQYLAGTVSLPIPRARVLEQPQGRAWRNFHNTMITYGGGWIIFGVTLLLALFLLLRGRIRRKAEESGKEMIRFKAFERGTHWVTASSFVVMALTGLIILYGKHFLQPILGASAYRGLASASTYVHITFAVPFVLGVVVMFVIWIRENLWTRIDTRWLLRGGGLFSPAGHEASAYRFNAGQKLVFWAVVLSAILLLLSGLALVFPLFWLGVVWTQIAQLIHAVVALLIIGLILGHIYLGTVGMQGAFDAMWSGKIGREWAREHHDLWARKLLGEEKKGSEAPAE